MKYFLLSLLASGILSFGVYVALDKPPVTTTTVVEKPVGAAASPDHYNLEQFFYGAAVQKFYGLGSVSASSGASSTAPNITLQLGNGSHGQFTLGTSTPATNVINASSSAITLNSMVFLQQTATTTLGGVTCNTTATVTPTTKVIFIATASSTTNGFQVTAGGTPATNPLCYNYWILDKSR